MFFIKPGSFFHLKLNQRRHHVRPVAVVVGAGVSHQKQLSEVDVVSQRFHAAQATDEIHGQVQLLEALAA